MDEYPINFENEMIVTQTDNNRNNYEISGGTIITFKTELKLIPMNKKVVSESIKEDIILHEGIDNFIVFKNGIQMENIPSSNEKLYIEYVNSDGSLFNLQLDYNSNMEDYVNIVVGTKKLSYIQKISKFNQPNWAIFDCNSSIIDFIKTKIINKETIIKIVKYPKLSLYIQDYVDGINLYSNPKLGKYRFIDFTYDYENSSSYDIKFRSRNGTNFNFIENNFNNPFIVITTDSSETVLLNDLEVVDNQELYNTNNIILRYDNNNSLNNRKAFDIISGFDRLQSIKNNTEIIQTIDFINNFRVEYNDTDLNYNLILDFSLENTLKNNVKNKDLFLQIQNESNPSIFIYQQLFQNDWSTDKANRLVDDTKDFIILKFKENLSNSCIFSCESNILFLNKKYYTDKEKISNKFLSRNYIKRYR